MAILAMSSVLNHKIKPSPWWFNSCLPEISKNVEDEFEDHRSQKLLQARLFRQYKFHQCKSVALEEISSHDRDQVVPKDLLYVAQN